MKKNNYEVAKEVLNGAWGNGYDRRERLTSAGYVYEDVQSIVNALVYGDNPEPEEKDSKPPLEIDYDINLNEGIIVNIII